MGETDTEGPIVILPGTDELNRGDQALVWQTMAIAQKSGYSGDYFMLSNPDRSTLQSERHGITPLVPLLSHPQTRYKPTSNLQYGVWLTLVWGIVAIGDSLRCLALLTRVGRVLLKPWLSADERRTLKVITASSACFVKGGGFLHSARSHADPYKAFFFLFHIFLAQSLGKKVFVMPNSFGPFEGGIFRRLVRAALRRCTIVTARETISGEALQGLGIESVTFPDLAFGLKARAPKRPSPIADLRRSHPGKIIVGLTARPYRFPGSSDPHGAYRRYIEEYAKLTARLKGDGLLPVFIEHVISDGVHESDMNAIEQIRSLEGEEPTPAISVPVYDCAELKYLYGECDYVVGTRFHSVIFSLSECTPALAIAYGGNKGVGIMRDVGLADYVVRIEDFSADWVHERLARLMGQRSIHERLLVFLEMCRSEEARLVKLVKARQ